MRFRGSPRRESAKISAGCRVEKSVRPQARNIRRASALISGIRFPPRNTTASAAPATTPATKTRLHASFFQLYLRYDTRSFGNAAAQACLNEEDTPKCLLLEMSSSGTMSPSKGPDMYHGHGWLKNSIILTEC